MGGGSSLGNGYRDLGKTHQALVDMLMPLYYDPVECTPAEQKLALDSWNMILTDKCPVFLEKRGTNGFPYTSCVPFFYDMFYVRLFDTHPDVRDLFNGDMSCQGKYLVIMLTLILSPGTKQTDYEKSLLRLADVHYRKGVRAVEYGIVGDVLLWALRTVMGEVYFTAALQRSWIKVYSRMLKILIPSAVTLELNGEAEDGRPPRQDAIFHSQQHSNGSTPEGTTTFVLESQKILNNFKTGKQRR